MRFTRDVDLVVLVTDDDDAERLIFELRSVGYAPVATVEHKRHHRLATARLASPGGVVVDLMFSNCGIEPEIVARATTIDLPNIATIPVASSEELVAMKVLSMTDARLQDRLDAQQLLKHAPVDLERVRANLRLMVERRYHRDQDLEAKLESVLGEIVGEPEVPVRRCRKVAIQRAEADVHRVSRMAGVKSRQRRQELQQRWTRRSVMNSPFTSPSNPAHCPAAPLLSPGAPVPRRPCYPAAPLRPICA